MTVWVVATEWNRGADTEGAITVEGAYDNPVAARRASWSVMRRYIRWGHLLYGRRNDEEWDADVTVQELPLLSEAPSREQEFVDELRGNSCPFCGLRFDREAGRCTGPCPASVSGWDRVARGLAVLRDEAAFDAAVLGVGDGAGA